MLSILTSFAKAGQLKMVMWLYGLPSDMANEEILLDTAALNIKKLQKYHIEKNINMLLDHCDTKKLLTLVRGFQSRKKCLNLEFKNTKKN